jgi:hypothetical protein
MRVYKVVKRLRSGRLASAFAEGCIQVTYNPGKPTSGVWGTPVLAFASLNEARALGLVSGEELWEAEAEGTKPVYKLPWLGKVYRKHLVAAWWEGSLSVGAVETMPGTLACDKLTLVRRVDAEAA